VTKKYSSMQIAKTISVSYFGNAAKTNGFSAATPKSQSGFNPGKEREDKNSGIRSPGQRW